MLLDQLREQGDLTHHERAVAQYILNHLTDVESLSAADLAQASLTSKATVVRLSKKLGLSGYQELKLKLLVEINQKQRLDQLLAQEPITGNSRYQDIIETLPKIYDKSLTNTRLSLKKTSINRIANQLQQAGRIDLYGIGISYLLAQTAAFKFATLGREVQAYESLNHHYLAARKQEKTVSLLISFTGQNAHVIEMARYLRETTDSYVVALAGPHHEDLLPWCHELVEIPNRDSLLSLDVISSFAGANYVLDIFFALLLARQYDHQAAAGLKMLTDRGLLEKK